MEAADTDATMTTLVGSVTSGDVELFYRLFGERDATPVLIVHGADYYDSRDWVEIAQELGSDRAVVSYDLRGYGLSSWSPNQDYSLDATLLDMEAVLDHLGWDRAVLVGHSRGGSFALRYAHEHADRAAGLVMVDSSPGLSNGRAGIAPLHVGPWGAVYESIDQAHAATSRNPAELDSDAGCARAECIFARRDGGWANIRRDPAFQNDRPADRPHWRSGLAALDPWEVLAAVLDNGTPTLALRATRSASYDDTTVARLRSEFASVRLVEIDCGHDIPGAAPAELVAAVSEFLAAARI